jgi:hypothetical protein
VKLFSSHGQHLTDYCHRTSALISGAGHQVQTRSSQQEIFCDGRRLSGKVTAERLMDDLLDHFGGIDGNSLKWVVGRVKGCSGKNLYFEEISIPR